MPVDERITIIHTQLAESASELTTNPYSFFVSEGQKVLDWCSRLIIRSRSYLRYLLTNLICKVPCMYLTVKQL